MCRYASHVTEEYMCRLRNIAMRDYQDSVTTGQTDRQTPDKVIHMCRYASQATQKGQDGKTNENPKNQLRASQYC